MASKTLSQSAHAAIMHQFTLPVALHDYAFVTAKMKLLYGNVPKILLIFMLPSWQAQLNHPLIPIIMHSSRVLTHGANIYNFLHNKNCIWSRETSTTRLSKLGNSTLKKMLSTRAQKQFEPSS